jgi:hypothetical protein
VNIGTICYATQSGLGHLAKMFYDNGIVNRIFVIPHPCYESYANEWYPSDVQYNIRDWNRFLEGLDAIITFENVFNFWAVVQSAQRQGTKFLLMPMYEWSPHPLPVKPDHILCPSLLDVEYYKEYPHTFIHVPASKDIVWKERTTAIQFVHNAGHGQVGYAKGTPEVLEAFAKHVRSEATILVRGQRGEKRISDLFNQYKGYSNIELRYGDISYNELFDIGDVYINAERYNGLSLPLQEAYSAGMLVMTTNRFPANTWLPTHPLIPVASYENHRVSQREFERATIDPRTIANYVDAWYGRDIKEFSHMGKQWAEENSWEKLKPIYMETIARVVGK